MQKGAVSSCTIPPSKESAGLRSSGKGLAAGLGAVAEVALSAFCARARKEKVAIPLLLRDRGHEHVHVPTGDCADGAGRAEGRTRTAAPHARRPDERDPGEKAAPRRPRLYRGFVPRTGGFFTAILRGACICPTLAALNA